MQRVAIFSSGYWDEIGNPDQEEYCAKNTARWSPAFAEMTDEENTHA